MPYGITQYYLPPGRGDIPAERAPSAVGHETPVVGQVERRLPGQRLVNQACHFELDALSDG